LGAVGDVDSLEWDEDWVSPSYGSRTLAPRARIVRRGVGRCDLVTVLAPPGNGGQVELTELEASEGRSFLLARPGLYDLFLLGTEGKVSVAGVEGIADAVLIRRSSVDDEIDSIAVFGADARVTVGGLTLHAKGGGEWSSTDFAGF
jgi:hypothetical protein